MEIAVWIVIELLFISLAALFYRDERGWVQKLEELAGDLRIENPKRNGWSKEGISVAGTWMGRRVEMELVDRHSILGRPLARLRTFTDLAGRLYMRNMDFIPGFTEATLGYLMSRNASLLDGSFAVAADQEGTMTAQKILEQEEIRMMLLNQLEVDSGEMTLEKGMLAITCVVAYDPDGRVDLNSLREVVNRQWRLQMALLLLESVPSISVELIPGVVPACPFCHADVSSKDKISQCRACQTMHHNACWTEYGKCSVFGCEGRWQ